MTNEKIWISPSSLKSDKQYDLNGVKIEEYFIANHNVNNIELPNKRTNPFKGVVIHNTNGVGSVDDGRQYTAATINGNMASRTHYYITDISAWRNFKDEDMNWTCGDGAKGPGNNGCISLEIIMNSKTNPKDLKARDNGARIAAYILWKNNMTIDDMYTHNYFINLRNGVKGDYNKLCTTPTPTRNCPYYIVWDWDNFRKQVDGYIKDLKNKNEKIKPIVTNLEKNIYIAISRAAIRQQPNKLGSIITRVVKGNYYVANRINENWIQHLDNKGYSMLKDGGSLFTKVGEYQLKTTTTKVNVRSGPSAKSNKIITLPSGAEVAIFKENAIRNEGYTWNKIIINHQIGYIAGEYLK